MRTHSSYALMIAIVAACGGGGQTGDRSDRTTTAGDPTAGDRTGDPAAAPPEADKPKDLFTRLGGKPAIEAVVGEFVKRLAGDARVKFRFANANIAKLTTDLVDFVCLATGGPCTYRGRNMADAHEGMRIRDDEFDALVDDLVRALDQHRVPAREKDELLALLGRMRNAITDH